MKFSRDDLRSLFNEKHIIYVENKHRGGSINQRGNRYEDFFATYQIVKIVSREKELSTIMINSQEEYCFVDDLIIKYRDTNNHDYFQCKTSASLSWSEGQHSLEGDFSMQYTLCNSREIQATTNLVCSDQDVFRNMTIDLPDAISSHTNVVFFKFEESITVLIEQNPDFKELLCSICAIEDPSSDVIEILAKHVLGAWVISPGEQSIAHLLDSARKIQASFIAIDSPFELPEKFKKVLDQIEGLSYRMNRGYFSWNYKRLSGTYLFDCTTDEFSVFIARIMEQEPNDFNSIQNLLI